MHVTPRDCLIQVRCAGQAEYKMFLGTNEELDRTIAATWKNVPHYVQGAGFLLEVYAKSPNGRRGDRLAVFIVTPLTAWPRIPGRL